MYDNLIAYRPFHTLISKCRGNAVSLAELAAEAFPDVGEEEALNYVSILLAIAPLARMKGGSSIPGTNAHAVQGY